MKITYRLLAAVATLLMVSCGNNDPVDTATITLSNLIGHNVTTDGKVQLGNASATLNIDYIAGLTAVNANNGITDLPIGVTNVSTTVNDRQHGIFAKRDNNYEIRGWFDDLMHMGMVNYSTAASTTILHSPRLLSKIATGNNTFSTDYSDEQTAHYYDLRMSLNDGKISADLYIYNVRFVNNMPVIDTRIPLEQLDIVADGYSKHIDSLTPYFIENNIVVPMPERQIENLDLHVNLRNGTMAIAFDCFRQHFTDNVDLYGMWTSQAD